MGWPVAKVRLGASATPQDVFITEGVTVPLALETKYLCFTVEPEESYVPGLDSFVPAVAERHDAIRKKGWKLIAVRQKAWDRVRAAPHKAHQARSDFLLRLTLREAPFEQRRVVLSESRA